MVDVGSAARARNARVISTASADGVAESRCGAGVEEERNSSDPLSDGGTGRV